MKKRWIAAGLTAVVLTGGLVAARSRGKTPPKEEPSPFRLGKVQAEDLQVSVREVGVVDPETKVDVKSAVSGRVVSLKVRDGAVVKTGDVLAEVEPDVTQAQSLSDVQAGVRDSRLRLEDAEREYANQKALFDNGLVGSDALKAATNKHQTSRPFRPPKPTGSSRSTGSRSRVIRRRRRRA